MHDDIYIHDWQLGFHLEQALTQFDLIGVVGASHINEDQPGWWHILDENQRPARNDATRRSGSINHFDPHLVRPCLYGPSPQNCDLLDGAFLAIRTAALTRTGLRFDPQFRLHCYDTDFCHSARRMGLRIGTWPIPLTHGSAGNFDRAWVEEALRLQNKLRGLT
jgi:GT2 family glycosyltransferase